MFSGLLSYSMVFLLACGLMVLVVVNGIALGADFADIKEWRTKNAAKN